MEQRLSLVTLGVKDVAASRAFYEQLGWRASGASQEGVAFFQMGGGALALYGREDLRRDAGLAPAGDGVAAITLAQNLPSPEAVEMLSHLSPHFRSSTEGWPLEEAKKLSWPEQLKLWKERIARFPDVQFHTVTVSVAITAAPTR